MYIVNFHHVDFDRNPGDDEFALTIDALQDYLDVSLNFIPEQNQLFKLFHEGEPAYYKVVKTCKVITSVSSSQPNHFDIFVLKYDSEAQFKGEIYSALDALIG